MISYGNILFIGDSIVFLSKLKIIKGGVLISQSSSISYEDFLEAFVQIIMDADQVSSAYNWIVNPIVSGVVKED